MTNPTISLTPGQRWISQAEPELGIGILVNRDKRTLNLRFPAAETFRQYSLSAAPIQRVRFKPGDRIQTQDLIELVVERVEEDNGLLVYVQADTSVREDKLAHTLSFSLPQDRLLAGLAQESRLFDLRQKILTQRAAYERSGARGFLGGQIDLIPHQFYIAWEVSARAFPRVLLSDETGLGKTIEAALIVHHLLITHQARRVLIIVPRALVHQWFIELFRKFNLSFRIVDQAHCQGNRGDGATPFLDDQQVICSQSFIMADPDRRDQILSAGWDMVVMDEAHHITESRSFYRFMQALGTRTRGLMLLTATPEQMGPQTHFDQLRLLDPDRYPDFKTYESQARAYEKTADQVRRDLAQGKDVSHLVDTYGPGRVIFRNQRQTIKGFPDRRAVLLPLKGSSDQIRQINRACPVSAPTAGPDCQPIASGGVADLTQDPRIRCLADLALDIKPEKILVICGSADTAGAVDKALKSRIAVDAARFDETMTLIQRDRNAAWFAREDGARLLICSEIGSEGRNFQFVHHLFLFDLPMNPELLEQRIGRVDRIGQKQDIVIHVPYVEESVQEILALWYARGLGLLEKNVNGSHQIFTRFSTALARLMANAADQGKIDRKGLADLLAKAAAHTEQTQAKLDRGKHILVALNSFKPEPARELIRTIRELDRDPGLAGLMETLLDRYGIELDPVVERSGHTIVRLQMDRMADDSFPALPRNGATATFDRACAIAREEIAFLTWDHPFVNQVLDFFITKGEGMAATARITGAAQPGLFLEALFLLACPDLEQPENSHLRRFLPARPIRVLVDHTGRSVPVTDLENRLEPDQPGWFLDMDVIKTRAIPEMLDHVRQMGETAAAQLRSKGIADLDKTLGREVCRLDHLKAVNPDITDLEIQAAQDRLDRAKALMAGARVQLDALRLIRAEP